METHKNNETTHSLSEGDEWEREFNATVKFTEVWAEVSYLEIKQYIRTLLSKTRANEKERMVAEVKELSPFVIGVGQDPLISKDAVLHIIDPSHQSNTIEDLYLSQEKEEIYQRGKRDGLREHTCMKAVEKIVYRTKKDHPRSKHLAFGICSNGQLVGQTYKTKEEALIALGGMARASTGEMPKPEHTHIIKLQSPSRITED